MTYKPGDVVKLFHGGKIGIIISGPEPGTKDIYVVKVPSKRIPFLVSSEYMEPSTETIQKRRYSRRPAMNPRRKKKNPSRGPVLIYGRILRIEAQKTQRHRCDVDCKRKKHSYYHDFDSTAQIWGMPDGSVVIKGKKRIWGKF